MPIRRRRFKDTLHGFRADAGSKMGAWQLIRSQCHALSLPVPQLSQIIELA